MSAMPEHSTGTCASGDVTLHYRRFGTAGAPPMLIVHGLSAVSFCCPLLCDGDGWYSNVATPDADETTRQPVTQPEPVDTEGHNRIGRNGIVNEESDP